MYQIISIIFCIDYYWNLICMICNCNSVKYILTPNLTGHSSTTVWYFTSVVDPRTSLNPRFVKGDGNACHESGNVHHELHVVQCLGANGPLSSAKAGKRLGMNPNDMTWVKRTWNAAWVFHDRPTLVIHLWQTVHLFNLSQWLSEEHSQI